MSATESVSVSSFPSQSCWLRSAPAFTLLVLAPVVAEVLSGATRLSFIFVLIPEIMVWGCGALLAREAVRRWRAGWTSLLLLGLALSVAAYLVLKRLSTGCGWRDIHRWALIFGALLVSMTAGFLGSSTWPRVDLVAKAVLNVVAVLCLIALARSISRRDRALSEEPAPVIKA